MKYILLSVFVLVTVVPPKKRPPKNMCFLIDKSGSMTTDKVSDALQEFVNIAGAPVDDGSICVYQFAKYAIKWKHGWKPLPNKNYLDLAQLFLNNSPKKHTYNGYTNIVPSLVAVLREPKKKMSVIIITDGDFDEEDDEVIATIKKWQKWRVMNGYGQAAIGCVGVGNSKSDALKAIAKLGTGIGYYHVEKEKEKEKELVEGPW